MRLVETGQLRRHVVESIPRSVDDDAARVQHAEAGRRRLGGGRGRRQSPLHTQLYAQRAALSGASLQEQDRRERVSGVQESPQGGQLFRAPILQGQHTQLSAPGAHFD